MSVLLKKILLMIENTELKTTFYLQKRKTKIKNV